jgi:hypothetical protein
MAVGVLGIAAAAAVGWLSRQDAYGMLFLLVAGGGAIGRWLGPALLRPQPSKDKPAEPGAPPDRGGVK